MSTDETPSKRPLPLSGSPPRSPRRRWQFGLSTLLLVVTACAIVSWWYSREEPWDQFQKRFTEKIEKLGGEVVWGDMETPTRVSLESWGFSDRKAITDADLKELRRDLGRLGPFSLDLGGSPRARASITDEGLKHLSGLLRLECLCLRHTQITDEVLPHLAKLKGLEFVDLRDTSINDAVILKVARDNPKLVLWKGKQTSAVKTPSAIISGWTRDDSVPGVLGTDVLVSFEWTNIASRRSVELNDVAHFHAADGEPRVYAISAQDLLLSLHGPISDSGALIARLDISQQEAKVVWRAVAKPLGVSHSKYRHDVHIFAHGDRCVLVSDGAETFVETRDLATGALLKRWVY